MIECYAVDDGHVCILEAGHGGAHCCCCLLEWEGAVAWAG